MGRRRPRKAISGRRSRFKTAVEVEGRLEVAGKGVVRRAEALVISCRVAVVASGIQADEDGRVDSTSGDG